MINDYFIESDDFYEQSLSLIKVIYEKCPLVEYLSIAFPSSKEHSIEFEKLLKVCQKLRVLSLDIYDAELLKVLNRSAPINLREIRFFNDLQFSLETLEAFLGKWKGQPLSILTTDTTYEGDDYMKLINKYKNDGVIKDFKCGPGISIYYKL